MTRIVPVFLGAACLLAAGALVSGCEAKVKPGQAVGDIDVTATDEACLLSQTKAGTGNVVFRVANKGSKVTEFYVYATGDRVVGEVENIGPGVTRTLIVPLDEPGSYQTSCRPGMIGQGVRGAFAVTGASVARQDPKGLLAKAAAEYKQYVLAQLDAFEQATTELAAKVKAGDVAGAKAQYPVARVYYERIEPVAETFQDPQHNLDLAIDMRIDDAAGGVPFVGYHRLEQDLWEGLKPDSGQIADQLVASVGELVAKIEEPGFEFAPLDIAHGAQGLLDEIAATKVSGEEDRYSHTDLWDFQANIEGSQHAIAALRPVLDERKPDLGPQIDAAFAVVQKELDALRSGDGFVLYNEQSVPPQKRKAFSDSIDALSAKVSQVQGIVSS
ncbi:MAG: iron uptake system protein EfeO [Segniliparus sp.]|uniref:iron uptake system protein EfeO n=1 Tax=Segniliparus sp. TaxID=2804064 RepID=UPI003F2DAA04